MWPKYNELVHIFEAFMVCIFSHFGQLNLAEITSTCAQNVFWLSGNKWGRWLKVILSIPSGRNSPWNFQELQDIYNVRVFGLFFDEIWHISLKEQFPHFGQHFGANTYDICCLCHLSDQLCWPKYISDHFEVIKVPFRPNNFLIQWQYIP